MNSPLLILASNQNTGLFDHLRNAYKGLGQTTTINGPASNLKVQTDVFGNTKVTNSGIDINKVMAGLPPINIGGTHNGSSFGTPSWGSTSVHTKNSGPMWLLI